MPSATTDEKIRNPKNSLNGSGITYADSGFRIYGATPFRNTGCARIICGRYGHGEYPVTI